MSGEEGVVDGVVRDCGDKGAVDQQKNPLKWMCTAFVDWGSWRHVLPLLSLGDLYALSQAGEMFATMVRLFFASGEIMIEGEFLKALPPEANKDFYKFIGRLATRLIIQDPIELDILPLLSCFPHLRELTLRGVIVTQTETEGFPINLRKLVIDECKFHLDFLEHWLASQSTALRILHLIDVDVEVALDDNTTRLKIQNSNLETLILKGSFFAGDLKLPKLKKLEIEAKKSAWVSSISCPNLEHFYLETLTIHQLDEILNGLDGSLKSINTLILSKYPRKEIGLLNHCPNLKQLTIFDPIASTEDWATIKSLSLEVFNCSFTAAPVEVLPDDCLIKILCHLDTEDCIALTHVNRRMRRLVMDHVYATAEIKLRPDYERYPLTKCWKIYEVVAERVKKLVVEGTGTVKILSQLDYPRLKSLKVYQSKIEGYDGVPAGLLVLHLEDEVDFEKTRSLLPRVNLTLQDLRSSYKLINNVTNKSRLRKFKGGVSLCSISLEGLLKQNPHLETLDVHVYSTTVNPGTINSLLEAFKSAPLITSLTMDLKACSAPESADLVLVEGAVLPNLKELKLQYTDPDQRDCVAYFVRSICPEKLKKLSIESPFRDMLRFKGLECLRINKTLDSKTMMDLVKALPQLTELNGNENISFPDGLELISYLGTHGRKLAFNGKMLPF